jgi:hypothetical protein
MMEAIRCEICKRELKMDNPGPLCWRATCKLSYDARQSLLQRQDQFMGFFTGRVPDEANYFEYFNLTGLEESYQKFLAGDVLGPRDPISRRTWFQLNIASIHAGWADEYGRGFKMLLGVFDGGE